ncbi:hypothetical protein HaLaN_00250, partial [Haematococcus lacustris]
MMWLTPLKPSAVRLLGRPPPLGVRDFLHGKLRLLPDGTRGSALKDEMHGVIHYPLRASGACAINENDFTPPTQLAAGRLGASICPACVQGTMGAGGVCPA